MTIPGVRGWVSRSSSGRHSPYSAITFGFGSILVTFFDVSSGTTGYFFAVIAFGNLLGPLLLGRLFDTWAAGR